MFSRARIGSLVLLVAGVLMSSGAAMAQTATANLDVSATAVARCTIAAAPLAFGTYDPTSVTDLNGSSDLTVRCTRGVTASIGLDNGQNPGATRQMASGTERLPYALYRDAGRTQTWLDTAGNLATYTAGSNAPTTLTVYGQVPAGANVPAGAFADRVVATVNF